MTKIKIISIPDCSAPESIKKAWLDIEIPIKNIVCQLKPGSRNTDKEDPQYAVEGIDAISALLDAGKKDAANYWDPYKTGKMYFPKNLCRVIN